tara:strand:+ start:167 stop:334 length:168 start_codon:yes stop_codon:yes gene_type:complete
MDQSIEDLRIENLRDSILEKLENYNNPNYCIKSILAILPQSQLVEIMDSIERDIF